MICARGRVQGLRFRAEGLGFGDMCQLIAVC
jgi:hypothetical protein